MATTRIPLNEVQPGDVLIFMGRPHLITSTDQRNAFGWQIARADDGWGISLDPDGGPSIEVAR